MHSSSFVDEGAKIGAGTKIWHFSHVMNEVEIGVGCNLGQNVVVHSGVVLGDRVKVQNNVSIYSGVVCEDEVFLGPSVVFTNIKNPRSAVERKASFLLTRVRKGASIGANATIVCGNELGAYSMIGAGAVITKDVLPFALVVGNPAKQIGWVSKRGNRLLFDEEGRGACLESGELYLLENGCVRLLESFLKN